MIVCWSTMAGFLLAVLTNSTSGIPVMVAHTPLAVPKCGVKQLSKNIPCFVRSLKNGVVFSGLPHMELLYALNDSQMTSTIFGWIFIPLSRFMILLSKFKAWLSGFS